MVGREVTPTRRAAVLANGSINAFTLSHKSAVLRLAPLNVYVHSRAHTHTHVDACMCVCVCARAMQEGTGTVDEAPGRFTVKALFE